MYRKYYTIKLFILFFLLSGCATMISEFQPVDFEIEYPISGTLSSYKNIIIKPNIIPADIKAKINMSFPEKELNQIFTQLGFNVISQLEFDEMSSDEKYSTLFCNSFYWTIPGYYIESFNLSLANVFGDKLMKINCEYNIIIRENMFSQLNEKLKSYYSGYDIRKKIDVLSRFPQTQQFDKNEEEIINYFNLNSDTIEEIEGVWTDIGEHNYKIAIIKDDYSNSYNKKYLGVILESDHLSWLPKQIKIELMETAYKDVYTAVYFLDDHTTLRTTAIINDLGILEIGLDSKEENEISFMKNYPVKKTKPNKESTITSSVGTGLLITQTGLIITNYHVVEDASQIIVEIPKYNKKFETTFMLKDENNDLAVLKLNDFIFSDIFLDKIPFTIITSSNVKTAEAVYSVGFPMGEILGKSVKFSTGIISSRMGIDDDPRVFQISNPTQPGNSGSPLFNLNGELIGIVVSSLNDRYFYEKASFIPQNVNFAIKSDYLINLISLLPEKNSILERNNLLQGMTVEKQIELLEPFVVRIKTSR